MRKSVVLALLLVLAVAGSSFAATVTWSGEFEATAEYMSWFRPAGDAKFFGNYGREAGASLDIGIKDDQDVWSVDFKVKGLVDGDADLGKYTLKVNEEAFQVTAWGKYAATDRTGIGHRGDKLELLRVLGTNTSGQPKFRLTTNVGGFDMLGQVEAGKVLFNGETAFDNFSLGATLSHKFATTTAKSENEFGVYGGTELGLVNLDAAFATKSSEDLDSNKNYGVFGVKASSDITEQLKVGGSVKSYGDGDSKGRSLVYGVEGTYTEGLLQFGLNYDATNFHATSDKSETTIKVSAEYRGSADNNDFGKLFGGDYAGNVAFAFGGSYTVNQNVNDKPASVLVLNVTGPVVQDQFWLRGQVEMAEGEAGFEATYRRSDQIPPIPAGKFPNLKSSMAVVLDGTARVSEKLELKPHVATRNWTYVSNAEVKSLRVELGASYTLTEAASISAHFGQETWDAAGANTVNRYNGFGITVEF